MSRLPLLEQLVVDFDPDIAEVGDAALVRDVVLRTADLFSGIGITAKIESALRCCGYPLIRDLQERGFAVFADAKLSGIPSKLRKDGMMLAPYGPKYVTVMCSTGLASMCALKSELPHTSLLGVTVLTTHDENETDALYHRRVGIMVKMFARRGTQVPLDGYICSPRDLEQLRRQVKQSALLITPGVRSDWAMVVSDDQRPERAMTPVEAFRRGADAVVAGRPITQSPDPRRALLRTLDEIHAAQV